MSDWFAIAVLFVLDLLSKPVFWICVSLLWAATIVANSIDNATRTISRRLEILASRFRKRPQLEDDDDEYLDEL